MSIKLSLKELKDLLKIQNKKIKKRRRNKKKALKGYQNNIRSSSDHMLSSGTVMMNTSNEQSELVRLQRQALEDKLKEDKANKIKKEEKEKEAKEQNVQDNSTGLVVRNPLQNNGGSSNMRHKKGYKMISNKRYYNIIQYAPDKLFTKDADSEFSNKKEEESRVEVLGEKRADDTWQDIQSEDEAEEEVPIKSDSAIPGPVGAAMIMPAHGTVNPSGNNVLFESDLKDVPLMVQEEATPEIKTSRANRGPARMYVDTKYTIGQLKKAYYDIKGTEPPAVSTLRAIGNFNMKSGLEYIFERDIKQKPQQYFNNLAMEARNKKYNT